MKASKLTNSINNILNEDKFSKYTLKQIYDELGKEDFVNYVDKISIKIIKNLKTRFHDVTSLVKHSTDRTFPYINYNIPKGAKDSERFTIIFHILDTSLELAITYTPSRKPGTSFSHVSIKGDEVDISDKLKSAIVRCYQTMKKEK